MKYLCGSWPKMFGGIGWRQNSLPVVVLQTGTMERDNTGSSGSCFCCLHRCAQLCLRNCPPKSVGKRSPIQYSLVPSTDTPGSVGFPADFDGKKQSSSPQYRQQKSSRLSFILQAVCYSFLDPQDRFNVGQISFV